MLLIVAASKIDDLIIKVIKKLPLEIILPTAHEHLMIMIVKKKNKRRRRFNSDYRGAQSEI